MFMKLKIKVMFQIQIPEFWQVRIEWGTILSSRSERCELFIYHSRANVERTFIRCLQFFGKIICFNLLASSVASWTPSAVNYQESKNILLESLKKIWNGSTRLILPRMLCKMLVFVNAILGCDLHFIKPTYS